MAFRLMAGVRYFFFNSASSLFADYRAGINVAGPLSKYGRSELGLGYIWNNNWEVAAGLENELWNATDSFSELVKSRGFYVRLGYRFR